MMKRANMLVVCILFLSVLCVSVPCIFAEQTNSSDISVNINSASKDELISINGVGPTLAERIIAYRTENGPFKAIDDVKNVPGIGESKFAKIKAEIKV